MKVPFSQFLTKIGFLKRNHEVGLKTSKNVIGIIQQLPNSEEFEAIDLRPKSLKDYLQLYYSCFDRAIKDNYLIEMYNAGYKNEVYKILNKTQNT